MAEKTSPFLEAKWGWPYGSNGWNSGADENWLKFSYMFDANVDDIVSTLPAAVNGQAYFLTTDNRIYFVVDGTYYSTPVPKWFEFKIKATGVVYVFDGSTATPAATPQQVADALEAELAAPTGSDKIGAGIRTQTSKNLDFIGVRDYITTAIDGTTDNQAGIEAAVNAAIAASSSLYWPAGTYVSSTNIPNFHSVTHFGDGVLKRGSDTFKMKQRGGQRNILYASPTGLSSNDGLSASQASDIISAFSNLVSHGPVLDGRWRVQLAAGVYPRVPSQITGLSSLNYIEVFGPSVSYGVPTATIDAAGAGWGLYFANGSFDVWFKDIKGINATGDSVASAFICDNMGICFADNVHTDNTTWAGVNANNCTRLIAYGGTYSNSAGAGLRCYGGTLASIGRDGFRPQLVSCAIGVAITSSYGHIDYCDYSNCTTGIDANYQVHASAYQSTFTNCSVAIECDVETSNINLDAFTLANMVSVGNIMRCVGSPVPSERGYERQFWPFNGTNGRSSWGYTTYTSPTVKYQYSNNGTTAGFNLSSLAPATALWESNANTILALAAPDANYSSIWFADSTSPRHSELRASAGVFSMLFNTVSAYTFSNVRLAPSTNLDKALGSASLNFSDGFINRLRPGGGSTIWTAGSGSPEGVITAPVGSLYARTDASPGKNLYAKNNGAGSSNWALLATQGALNVRDYITTTIDGTTSNQAGIVAAVADALALGANLYWPDGTYVSTASIPSLHSVNHEGPGLIKRGSLTFAVNPRGKSTKQNLLHVAPAGSAANDGLSPSEPMATFQNAFDALNNYGPVLSGIWNVVAAAGTYDFSSGQQTFSTASKNRVVVRGPAVGHPGVPTAIIDGGGSGVSYRHGLSASGSGVLAEFRDIRAQNFTEPSANTRIGLLAENDADLLLTNCHTFACSWTGLYAAMASRFRVSGGIIDGNSISGAAGIITNDTECTIGYQASNTSQAPVVKNCTSSGIYWSRGSQGHIDYLNIQDCGVGLEMEQFSSAAIPGCDFKRNTVGIRLRPGALFRQDGVPVVFNQGTADANTTPFDYCTMSGNGDELRTAQSYTRFAYDRTTRTASGIVSGTFPTIYTIAADRLNGVGKSCRVHCKGVYTVTAGSSMTVNFGGMSLALTVGAAGTNVAFDLDVELMEVAGGYRAIGSLSQGASTFRYGTSTAGFDKTLANGISIGYSLAGAGDSLNIYRTDVYVMG